MGFVSQKFPPFQSWNVATQRMHLARPLHTGKLGGFFHNPKLYVQLSQEGALSRGDMSWESARRLSRLVGDRPLVADRLLVGAPLPEITAPAGPDSADVLPPTFGPSDDLTALGDVAPKEAHLAGLAYAKLLGLYDVQPDVIDEFRPTDDFVSEAGRARGLAYTVTDIQAEVLPQKLLAQRVLSMRSQRRMENIPLQPFPEDSVKIRSVIENTLTPRALYFLIGNSSKAGVGNPSYQYQKLAETMWFSMLWYGFSKFSPDRQADISVVMENLEDELHDRLTCAIAELNGPQLDRKLIAAATLAVIHPAAFTVDLKLLDKAVRSLAMMTVHQNVDVGYNASHMLVRLIEHAGDVHPEMVAAALSAMISDDNIQVSYTAAELLARVVENKGLEYSSMLDPAARAMRGAFLGLDGRGLGDAYEAASNYFGERFLRVSTVNSLVARQRLQAVREKLASVQTLVKEQLQSHP